MSNPEKRRALAKAVLENTSDSNAYIITGPTSGIGRLTARELAKHGTVVLVGRDSGKLDEVEKTIEKKGQDGVSVVCDLSDPASVLRAAAEITALRSRSSDCSTTRASSRCVP